MIFHIYFIHIDIPCVKKACKDPNAEFLCTGSGCQKTCAGLNRPCCVYTFVPVQACFCKEGFAQNNCGVCIPECSAACQREKLPPCKCGDPKCSRKIAS